MASRFDRDAHTMKAAGASSARAAFLIAAIMMFQGEAQATGTTSSWPPAPYRLSDVEISVRWSSPRADHTQHSMRLLSGNSARLNEGYQDAREVQIEQRDFVALIKVFYKSRFFDQPSDLHRSYSIFLNDDGLIQHQSSSPSDAALAKICFSVRSFEKCVLEPRDLNSAYNNALSALYERLVLKSE